MADVVFSFEDIPAFARAMKLSAPKFLVRATGKALFRIGRSDIDKMKSEQLSGGNLNVRSKGFANAFKFRASDSRRAKSVEDLQLSEYTGAKPFRIFQEGGEIEPVRSKTLTVLAPGGRNASGKRKYSRKELRDMIRSGEAIIIQTKNGPAVVKPDLRPTKKGTLRRGAKVTILAWLRPAVEEKQRIDFFGNYESNSADHERILSEAGDEAIEKTIADEEGEEE